MKNYLSILTISLFFFACSDAKLSGGGDAKKSGPPPAANGNGAVQTSDEGAINASGNRNDPIQVSYDDQVARGSILDSNGSQCPGTNLVANADFNQGNVAFTTEYTFQTTPNNGYMPGPEQHVTINDSPQTYHSGYRNDPNDSGNMLVINLAAVPRKKFWCQRLQVKKNNLYQISVRMRKAVSFDTSRSSLSEWTVGGNVFTGQFDPSGVWGKFLKTWVSDRDQDIELCGQNVAADVETADLVVDDILFIRCN